MITSFNSLCIRSNNYDLCETGSETPSDTALWIRKETAKCEAKAKEFFATKVRNKYYRFSGTIPEDFETSILCRLTDDEVARIKELTVEAYKTYIDNAGLGYDEGWASTFEEICEDIQLWELEGVNPELDDLIFNRYDGCDGPFLLNNIDFDNAHFLYDVTYQEYGEKPVKEKIRLSDEEYVYLLAQRLLNDKFTFNRLLFYRPELAQKINEQLDGCSIDYLFESSAPFLVVFDEVNADAAAIQKNDETK